MNLLRSLWPRSLWYWRASLSAFHRVRSAVAEHHRGHAVGLHPLHQRAAGLDGARVRGAAEGVEEGQLVELRDDGVAHRPAAVAQVAAPQAGHAVQQLVAVHVPHPAAFAAGDDVGAAAFGLHRLRVGHRVPQVLRVVALELFDPGVHRRLRIQPWRPSVTVLVWV
jgi:hypothetical protein